MNRNAIEKRQDIPKITVITVVYNAVNKIEETILSVINQDYGNIEYIIIDGGSNDGTVEIIIKKHTDKITFWSSSKDSGIYNAMNKGIEKSTGIWINFMNAGDRYVDDNVVSEIFSNKKNTDVDVIFGNSILEKNNKIQIKQPVVKPVTELWKTPVFRHGAMFTKTEIHKNNLFSEHAKYKICADYDFIYKIYTMNYNFKFIDLYVLVFEEEGISNNLFRNSINNRMIVMSYTKKIKYNLWHFLNILRCFYIVSRQIKCNNNT